MDNDSARLHAALEASGEIAFRGMLISSYVHELKHLVSAVVAANSVLEACCMTSRSREVHEALRNMSQRCEELARCLSTMDKLGSQAKDAGQERAASLIQSLREAIAIVRAGALKRGAKVVLRLPKNDVEVALARTDVATIVKVLSSNSLDAGARTLRLSVTARASTTGADAILTFADDGDGITPESLGSIGRPFFSTKPGGAGLGLYVVRRLIERAKGQFRITSGEPRGTTVVIVLPARSNNRLQRPVRCAPRR